MTSVTEIYLKKINEMSKELQNLLEKIEEIQNSESQKREELKERVIGIEKSVLAVEMQLNNLRFELQSNARSLDHLNNQVEKRFAELESFKNKLLGIAIAIPFIFSLLAYLLGAR